MHEKPVFDLAVAGNEGAHLGSTKIVVPTFNKKKSQFGHSSQGIDATLTCRYSAMLGWRLGAAFGACWSKMFANRKCFVKSSSLVATRLGADQGDIGVGLFCT